MAEAGEVKNGVEGGRMILYPARDRTFNAIFFLMIMIKYVSIPFIPSMPPSMAR